MSFCPDCNEEYDNELSNCPKCNKGWVVIGCVKDKTSADYAIETLKSYDVPGILFSESGFFGQAGLNLPSPSGKNMGMFKIQVPSELAKDAVNVMNMILGDSWDNTLDIEADE